MNKIKSPYNSWGSFLFPTALPYSCSLQLPPLFRGIFLEWNFRVGAWGLMWRWSVTVSACRLCAVFRPVGRFLPLPYSCPCAVVSVALMAFFRLWWRFACVGLALVALCGAVFSPSVPFSLFVLVRTHPPPLKRLKTRKNAKRGKTKKRRGKRSRLPSLIMQLLPILYRVGSLSPLALS